MSESDEEEKEVWGENACAPPAHEFRKMACYIEILVPLAQKVTESITLIEVYKQTGLEFDDLERVMRRAQTPISAQVMQNMFAQSLTKLRDETFTASDTMFLFFSLWAFLLCTEEGDVITADERRVAYHLLSWLTCFTGEPGEDFERLISPDNLLGCAEARPRIY